MFLTALAEMFDGTEAWACCCFLHVHARAPSSMTSSPPPPRSSPSLPAQLFLLPLSLPEYDDATGSVCIVSRYVSVGKDLHIHVKNLCCKESGSSEMTCNSRSKRKIGT
jgi:hypothetical protein